QHEALLGAFVGSAECEAGQQETVYVTMLYLGLLERPASDPEISGWADSIRAGNALQTVVNAFLNSEEYRIVTAVAKSGATECMTSMGSENSKELLTAGPAQRNNGAQIRNDEWEELGDGLAAAMLGPLRVL
ncbi:MAG TPA: DUF4214 domain-containing protein, partial [Dehalococcoidia bacterium]|nr:DUF4214 domain-containing protein [Dehalococcoidia bacterium]